MPVDLNDGVVLLDARPRAAQLGLLPRIGMLASLFIAELLVLSIWLDGATLSGSRGLAELVANWGSWAVRLSVAVALGSLIFGESRAKSQWSLVSEQIAHHPIDWRLLMGHLAAMLAFGGLSGILFARQHAGLSGNMITAAWFATGVLGIVLAAGAFVPSAAWAGLLRSSGDAWMYVLAAGLVACVLGLFAWKMWTPLARVTFHVVSVLLRPFVDVVAIPSRLVLGTPRFRVQIADECSGYEGIGLVLAFGTAWLWFLRREWRFPQALLLLPAGVATIWILNALRIAALILIGNAGASRIALGGFHSQAGWISFNIVALGLCVLARRVPWFVKPGYAHAGHGDAALGPVRPASRVMTMEGAPYRAGSERSLNPTAAFLVPFLAILGATMLSRSMTGDFEWFYPLRVVAALLALWIFRQTYRGMQWRFGWFGVAIGIVVFVLWIGLDRFSGGGGAAKNLTLGFATASRTAQIAWLIFRIAGAVITVPIAEELAFRGFLYRRLAAVDFESVDWRKFAWIPFLVSSIAFGLLHGERWLAGTVAGMFYAIAVLRRGRIGEAVAAHATTNALLAIWVLATGNWALW